MFQRCRKDGKTAEGLPDTAFPESSGPSFGRRSAHQAIACAQQFLREGYAWVVDLDVERFFDRVVHEVLVSRFKQRITDPRLLKLIDRYLKSGVMIGTMLEPTEEGVPQGGPLSPLLANLLLDDLDRELERRGHRFVRYAKIPHAMYKDRVFRAAGVGDKVGDFTFEVGWIFRSSPVISQGVRHVHGFYAFGAC
jgi:hypothetical protein